MTPKKAARAQADADLAFVLQNEAGRRFFWRLLEQLGLQSLSYAESPTATAFNEGRRSAAINLLREAQRVSPLMVSQGLREKLKAVDLEATAEKPIETES